MTMRAGLLLSYLLFCPLTDPHVTNGYHVWVYNVVTEFVDPQPCPPGLCREGWATGTLPHVWFQDTYCIDPPNHVLNLSDPFPGELLMFSVEPNNTSELKCAPGGCADVWWTPNPDPNAPCDVQP